MKVRRQGGATLGLVAACVFLVIVIGVGFYFLSKIIGGGREVANATDGGALNVAKQALVRGTVDLTTIPTATVPGYTLPSGTAVQSVPLTAVNEFGGLVDPNGPANQITLVTYNRVVAQAMMVCENAVIENTSQAAASATAEVTLVKAIGTALKASLATAAGSTLQTDFNSISNMANTKMWNGNKVACTGITSGYLKQYGSTNIIFDASTLASFPHWGTTSNPGPDLIDASTNNTPTVGSSDYALSPATGSQIQSGGAPALPRYMPGYDSKITFNLNSGPVSLTGVPVFPNTKPHIVDLGTFNNDLATNSSFASDSFTPPNAFYAKSQATEAKSGNVGGSLACAVVGVMNKAWKASFSNGFVRITNGQDAVNAIGNGGIAGLGGLISDGSQDIFNNQLFNGVVTPPPGGVTAGGGIYQMPIPGSAPDNAVFTTTPQFLTAWSTFNNRVGVYNNSSTLLGAPNPSWVGASGTAYVVGAFVPQNDLPTFADSNIQGAMGMGSPDSLADFYNTESNNPWPYDVNTMGLRIGTGCNQYPNLNQLEAIGTDGGQFNCNYTMYDNALTGPCALSTNITSWQDNYQCTDSLPAASNAIAQSGANQGVSNVEYLKAEVLARIGSSTGGPGRLGGTFCADVSIPNHQPSGVKYFSYGVPGTTSGVMNGSAVAFDTTYAPSAETSGNEQDGASHVVNFQTVGTPYQYLSQITNPTTATAANPGTPGACASTSSSGIIGLITARLQQVDSSITAAQVQSALQTSTSPSSGAPMQLHLQNAFGSSTTDSGFLYLYVNSTTHQVTMDTKLPASYNIPNSVAQGLTPDGPAATLNNGTCTDNYPLNGWVVDTQFTMSGDNNGNNPKGDSHYHDQPFCLPTTQTASPPTTGPNNPIGNTNGWGTAVQTSSPDIGNASNPIPIYGQDAAIFTPSSGFSNMLGELKFQQNAQGTTFCNPN